MGQFNQALLGKRLCHFTTKKDTLWRKVVGSKYGYDWGGRCSKEVRGGYGVCLWKYI